MASSNLLSTYYDHVQQVGQLATPSHAQRWSRAVLQTLGTALPRRVKKALSKALPESLAKDLNGVFWLAHFPDTNMPAIYFQTRVAMRSGNTDKHFAFYPTQAVFGGVKQLVNNDVARQVADGLSAELRQIWEDA